MANLILAKLEAGMVLTADVTDRTGRVLLRAGVELNDKHLKVMKTWGVADACVEGGEAENELLIDPARLAEIEGEVRLRFRHCDMQHELMQILFRHAVQLRASKDTP